MSFVEFVDSVCDTWQHDVNQSGRNQVFKPGGAAALGQCSQIDS